MSSDVKKIDGSTIRSMLRDRGIPGGAERECCGGRKLFNRDYAAQLKALGMTGDYIITERGIVVDRLTVK